ncbi:hypothetical protein BTO15_16625 [Polaribacter sejongensis]|uniref:DUF4595 domain-containing protein n=1 Tax=Polaribacter sejongensis TaxID=985043 RepID=A0ABM6Q2X5_9FLAO|nr:hypothetical protein [Polaribacter sejongensis]AUC23618.1 hypothetical protein BTO15_16625 [Polaribacter sejongensis]
MKKIFSILTVFLTLAVTTVSCSSDDDAPIESSLATITDFSIAIDGVNAADIVYDLGTDILVTVPFGTNLTAVVPTIMVSENATVSPVSGAAISFVDGEAKTFTVTAEDEVTTKNYTVTITVRGEVGSGSQLKTYEVDELWFGLSTTTYSYNDANFANSITKEADEWGTIITTVTDLVYDDKNQIIEKKVTATNQSTIYTYESGKITEADYSVDDVLTYVYNYTYNEFGDLISEKRTDKTGDEDEVTETLFTVVDGNVTKEVRYGTDYIATYDINNNPFKGMYPTAYAAINVGIESINTNNPISGSLADDVVTYIYNTDNYPLSASYTSYDGGNTVEKTFTYYAN